MAEPAVSPAASPCSISARTYRRPGLQAVCSTLYARFSASKPMRTHTLFTSILSFRDGYLKLLCIICALETARPQYGSGARTTTVVSKFSRATANCKYNIVRHPTSLPSGGSRHSHDRIAYTAKKSEFIASLMERVKKEIL